jgi:hypothetical protein
MNTENTASIFSAWEREVFTALSNQNLPFADLNAILSRLEAPLDEELGNIVSAHVAEYYGDDVALPENFQEATKGGHKTANNQTLATTYWVQKESLWGSVEEGLEDILAFVEEVAESDELTREPEFLSFLSQTLLPRLESEFDDIRSDVEAGDNEDVSEEDLDAMDEAIGKVKSMAPADQESTESSFEGFSAWEREVFTAMTRTDGEQNLSLPEFNKLLSQETGPIDSALAGLVGDYMTFHFGEGNEEAVVEISPNITTASQGNHEGSNHDLLTQVRHLHYTRLFGDTEAVLHEVTSLSESFVADTDLHSEKEFLSFLHEEVLDPISRLYSDSIRDEVEAGNVTHMTIEDIDNMDAAIERVGELSKEAATR